MFNRRGTLLANNISFGKLNITIFRIFQENIKFGIPDKLNNKEKP